MTQNKWFWEHPRTRGFGWFIWKPLIILDALDRVNVGDIVLFTDADCFPIADFSVLYDICARQGGQMLFHACGQNQNQWCKRDCYIIMSQDTPEYTGSQAPAGNARYMLFQKGPWRPKQLLMEWLTYVCNPLANTFDVSVLAPEYPTQKQHRCEQAILTNLALKYKYKLWREIDRDPNDGNCLCEAGVNSYPRMFTQDGTYSYGGPPGAGSVFRNVND